jgi:hypothetical protein
MKKLRILVMNLFGLMVLILPLLLTLAGCSKKGDAAADSMTFQREDGAMMFTFKSDHSFEAVFLTEVFGGVFSPGEKLWGQITSDDDWRKDVIQGRIRLGAMSTDSSTFGVPLLIKGVDPQVTLTYSKTNGAISGISIIFALDDINTTELVNGIIGGNYTLITEKTTAFSWSVTDDTAVGVNDVVIPHDLLGLVHGGTTVNPDTAGWVAEQFKELRRIGVKWCLDDFSWNTIQRTNSNGEWDNEWNYQMFDQYVKNANEQGIKILGLLAYDTDWIHGGKVGETRIADKNLPNLTHNVSVYADGNVGRNVGTPEKVGLYREYVKRTVERYNGGEFGKVHAWSLWNEPDVYPRFWTASKEDFYYMTREAVKTIRGADNGGASIIAGSFSSTAGEAWIRGLFNSGAAEGADFIAFHPYSITSVSTARVFQDFVELSDAAFRNKVWVTEVGHPTNGGYRQEGATGYGTEVHIDKMPQTLVKTVVLLAASGAQKIFWYHLADSSQNMDESRRNDADSEDWFGLYTRRADNILEPKGRLPEAYKLVAENIPGKTWRASGLPGLELPDDVMSFYFEGDGRHCLVVWYDNFVNAPTVDITLPPGKNYTLHNPYNAESENVSASGAYALSLRSDRDEKVLFFTWDDN